MIGASTATGWYVYGVVAAGAAEPDLEQDVCLVEHDGVAAVAGEVPLDEFGDDAIVENLNNRAWLVEKARSHEEVLRAFTSVTPVVPLRFGAIYHELEDVRRMLEVRRRFFEATLARLRGHVEVGVKAWLDRSRLEHPNATTSLPQSGRAYLERRRAQLDAARTASAHMADLARIAHERLAAVAVDDAVNRPQPRELTGRTEDMLLNGAYLVREDDVPLVEEVVRLLQESAPAGVSYEITGPWPPYNFAHDQEGAL